MANVDNKIDIFRRCNLPEQLIRRFTSKGVNNACGRISNSSLQQSLKNKRHSSPAIRFSEDISPNNSRNKVNLEQFLLSIPLDNDVAHFSDTEGPVHNRLPLYSENYESQSFCLPSSGYKSDSESRGRSKYKIRTHSANPSPDQSPERPAQRASVRRTQSLNVPTENARVLEIRQKLKDSKRQEVLKNSSSNKNNIHERLKQLGNCGLNTTANTSLKSNSVNAIHGTKSSLRSRSLNQIAVTVNNCHKKLLNPSKETNNSDLKRTGNSSSVLRSRSFNSLGSGEIRSKEKATDKETSGVGKTNTASKTSSNFQSSPTSAFQKVREQFGSDKWARRVPVNTSHTDKNENNLRASSFSSLQDAWESRKTLDKVKKTFSASNNNKNSIEKNTRTHSSHLHQNSISDFESSDIISRRRERRRLKREIYNQRLQSDKSDSETETEDSHFARHALERLERRRANSNPKRSASRSSRLSEKSNDSDSNDENNNECPSDKTLDSGVFDLALSNLSANISKLSKRYNSDEFIADCLSPKSGYSSATESLAESLAESTTTFYDSNDDHHDMDSRRKRGGAVNRVKLKGDNKTSAKTAVLNSTRAKGNLINGTLKQTVTQSSNKNMPETSESSTKSTLVKKESKQTTNSTDQDQQKAHQKVNKRPSLDTTTDIKSQSLIASKSISSTSKEPPNKTTIPQKDKQILEKKSSSNKSPTKATEKGGDINKESKAALEKTTSKERVKKEDSNTAKVADKTTEKSTEKEKKQLRPPKTKNDVAQTIPVEQKNEELNNENQAKKEIREKIKSPTPPKTAKIGLLSTDRKIPHHSCCTPIQEIQNEPTSHQKVSRSVSHQGYQSLASINNSRSNTPTRRGSHIGCFLTSENKTPGRKSPTRHRNTSHQNCFKPVNSTSESDNSRSNTPTSLNGDVTPTPKSTKVRQTSHHNCVESPTREHGGEKKSHNPRNSIQESANSMERNQKHSNVDYRIHLQSNSSNKAAIIMGPVQIKDEIKPKLARECVSPTLHNNSTVLQQQSNLTVESDSILFRINEKLTHNSITDDQADNVNELNANEKNALNSGSNEISTVSKQRSNDEQLNAHTGDSNNNNNTKDMAAHKKTQSLKFTLDAEKSKIESQNGKAHRLVKQGESISLGESIELRLSLDKNILNNTKNTSTQNARKVPLIAPKLTQDKPNQISESVHKAVQCLLLSEESNKILNVCDISREITLNEDIINEVGSDILQNIQFAFPDYLLTVEQKENMDKELKQAEMNIESDCDEELDIVDSATPCVDPKTHIRFAKEKEKSFQLKMENTRLQQLLYEVEKARAGTMKALLHVNTALNKVQTENTELESNIKAADQENLALKANVKEYQEKEKEVIENTGGKKGDRSLSIFVDQWRKEKKEMINQLNTLKVKKEESEKSVLRLQVQYKKMKEQLEHSNNAFTTTLQNNLEATRKMEEELKSSFDEKKEMLRRMNEGNKNKRELEMLKTEMEELRAQNEELQDENDSLEQKCKHLEKQKKQLQFEEEELHEQISHSQEIIEKLTDVEEELKERLHAEVKDKEYLQECLDETGHILYQLKNNENKLKQDRETLLGDLEQEQEEKQSLQTTLNITIDEHKEIINRLQDMTNIHSNVKESLQQANKKEKNYQDQIEALTKTNHILHYTLEKEKEERMDLQEMFDINESDHKKFKNESVGKMKDMENKIDDLSLENYELKQKSELLDKKCEELQTSLEHEEDENSDLSQRLSRLERLKEAVDKELESLQDNSEEMQKSRADLQKLCHELEVDLKLSRLKNEKMTCSLGETEESLERSVKDLTKTKRRLEEYRNDYDDLQAKNRERMKKIRELESTNEELTEQKDRFQNRMNYYETETRDLRKKVNEQTEEIGTLQIESQRFQRERDTHKRNSDMAINDFETHKIKCTESLKRLKEEIIELSAKIVEKDRLALKQKEQFQDQIENSQNDLKFLRSMLDGEIKRTVKSQQRNAQHDDSGNEKLDLGILKNSHDRFRDEFQSHVDKLEDMLKHSNDVTDSVTVVQSPMSKIKLEELKQLRNEMFDLQADLSIFKTKYANLSADMTSFKLGVPSTPRKYHDRPHDKQLEELENELTKLDELITRIESRHKAVMTRNAALLQRTLKEDDLTAKDLVKKFQVLSLESENKQLKTLLGILKKKYDFDEGEMADELNKVNKSEINGSITNGSYGNNDENDEFASDDEPRTSKRTRVPTRSQSTRRPQRNYSFFNEAVGATDLSTTRSTAYNRELHQRSSGVSSYSSEDDDYTPTPRLPKRYNTLPSRARRANKP